LGCWESFRSKSFMESHGTRAVWGGPEPYENEFFVSLLGNGWQVDCARFDALLRDCARNAGADLIADARLSGVRRNEQAFELDLRSAGRVKAPAGLPIGAVSPEEIAVSILAEIVQQGRSQHLPAAMPLPVGKLEAKDYVAMPCASRPNR
jgi:hypothetical protein